MNNQKILKLSAYISGSITILMTLLYSYIYFLLPKHSNLFFSKAEKEAIGIIGGADGPTAIFITTSTLRGISLGGLIVIFTIITIVLLLLYRNKKTND